MATAKKKTVVKKKAPKKAPKKAASATQKTVKKAKTPKQTSKVMDQLKEMTMQTPQFEQFTQNGFKQFEEMTSSGKDFFEALTKTTTILTAGFQDLAKEASETTQSSAEKSMAAAKDLMTSKTINELTEKQNTFAQDNWNETVNFVSKFTEKYTKLCMEAAEPLNQQVAKTMKETSKAA